MEESKVEYLWRSYFGGWYHLIEDIKKLLIEDPNEYKKLVSIFENLSSEKKLDEKLDLAEILSNFDCLQIKSFLYEVINDDENKLVSERGWLPIDNKIYAASYLVRMYDSSGGITLEKLAIISNEDQLGTIAHSLYGFGIAS
jgi:hypothetical protein